MRGMLLARPLLALLAWEAVCGQLLTEAEFVERALVAACFPPNINSSISLPFIGRNRGVSPETLGAWGSSSGSNSSESGSVAGSGEGVGESVLNRESFAGAPVGFTGVGAGAPVGFAGVGGSSFSGAGSPFPGEGISTPPTWDAEGASPLSAPRGGPLGLKGGPGHCGPLGDPGGVSSKSEGLGFSQSVLRSTQLAGSSSYWPRGLSWSIGITNFLSLMDFTCGPQLPHGV
mgnify:CR=1 FL=1